MNRRKKKWDRLLKLPEVAKALGVSYSAVWSWIKTRKLKKIRIRNQYRIKESELRKFLARPVDTYPPIRYIPGEYTLKELETRTDVFGNIKDTEIF